MENWQIFEENITNFLNELFEDVTITNTGDRDSTIPDLKVEANGSHLFIEAKYSPSQSGQIVVLMENGEFQFSAGSQNNSNVYTDQIISKLNENYNTNSNESLWPLKIEIDKNILYNWIKKTYEDKNAKWVISSKKKSDLEKKDLVFIPISEMKDYFDVVIKLRRKPSGSGSVPKKWREDVATLTKEVLDKELINIGKRSYVKLDSLPTNIHLNGTYCLKKEPLEGSLYEVRKKSSTNNPNVMFEVKLKDQLIFKEKEFKEFCRQLLSL